MKARSCAAARGVDEVDCRARSSVVAKVVAAPAATALIKMSDVAKVRPRIFAGDKRSSALRRAHAFGLSTIGAPRPRNR